MQPRPAAATCGVAEGADLHRPGKLGRGGGRRAATSRARRHRAGDCELILVGAQSITSLFLIRFPLSRFAMPAR